MVHDQLRQLLLEHDCVTLPGLGALLAEPVPARIHPVRQTLSPPARRLAFSDRLRHDDGLLTEAVRRSLNLPDPAPARERVLSFTEELHAALRQHRVAELRGLGTLRQVADDAPIRFEALEPGYLPLLSSFGLPELVARPVLGERSRPVPQPQLRPRESRIRRLLGAGSEPLYRLGTAVIVALCLSATYFSFRLPAFEARFLNTPESRPVATQAVPAPQRAAVADELPSESAAQPVAETVAPTPATEQPAVRTSAPVSETETTPPPVPASVAAAPAAPAPVAAASKTPVISTPTGHYHLVWNAFSSRRQAEKGLRQAARLAGDSGVEPMVLAPQRGGRLYRVVVGDYSSAAEAAQALPQLRAHYGPALWMLRY